MEVSDESPPIWMEECITIMRARYPHDRVVISLKPMQEGPDNLLTPEFRLKCLDCPGKLYMPGPEQTLSNFEVHLRNRTHRNNVTIRVSKESATSTGTQVEGSEIVAATPSTT